MKYDEYMQNFKSQKVKNDIVEWIRSWFAENGNDCNAIIGISGGKDSSVVAALCVEALGKDRVIGVLMPNGEQGDICDSQAVVKHLGIQNMVINIGDAVNATLNNVYNGLTSSLVITQLSEQTKINLPARVRMATLYAVAQTCNGRVANTCNLSEDWVGYSTRYGDSAGDFSPLSELTTDEVVAIGKECGLPAFLVEKTPSDGLCGKTDEDNLGFTYRTLNEYIRTGVCNNIDLKSRIDCMHKKNLFKMQLMPTFSYSMENNC